MTMQPKYDYPKCGVVPPQSRPLATGVVWPLRPPALGPDRGRFDFFGGIDYEGRVFSHRGTGFGVADPGFHFERGFG